MRDPRPFGRLIKDSRWEIAARLDLHRPIRVCGIAGRVVQYVADIHSIEPPALQVPPATVAIDLPAIVCRVEFIYRCELSAPAVCKEMPDVVEIDTHRRLVLLRLPQKAPQRVLR